MTDEGSPAGGDDLSRRAVLAALGGTGAAGALASSGSGAVISDREVAQSNALAAGALDIDLCWEPTDTTGRCDPVAGSRVTVDLGALERGDAGSGTIRCSHATASSNPAWLWVRTPCPAEACGLERALEVSLWYDEGCDGVRGDSPPVRTVEGDAIVDVSLCEALEMLSDGIALDGQPQSGSARAPSDPGSDCCLGLSWRMTDAPCTSDTAALELEFFAEQVRHNEDPNRPWAPRECTVDCTTECDTECVPASFVAFCKERKPIDMTTITSLTWTADSVTWTADTALDSVVLFYGPPTFETFAPDGGFPAGQSHTITRGNGEVLSDSEADSTYGQSQNDPCPDVDGEGCGVRYNFPETRNGTGSWDCVCGPPGPDRECGGDGDD